MRREPFENRPADVLETRREHENSILLQIRAGAAGGHFDDHFDRWL
jgi:hypothetical protein